MGSALLIGEPICQPSQLLGQLMLKQDTIKHLLSPDANSNSNNINKANSTATIKLINRLSQAMNNEHFSQTNLDETGKTDSDGINFANILNNLTNFRLPVGSSDGPPFTNTIDLLNANNIRILANNQQSHSTIFEIKVPVAANNSHNNKQQLDQGYETIQDKKRDINSGTIENLRINIKQKQESQRQNNSLIMSGRTNYSANRSKSSRLKINLTYKNEKPIQISRTPSQANKNNQTTIYKWKQFVIKRAVLSQDSQANVQYMINKLQQYNGKLSLQVQQFSQKILKYYKENINNEGEQGRQSAHRRSASTSSMKQFINNSSMCKLVGYLKQHQGFLCGSHSNISLIFQHYGQYTLHQQIQIRASQVQNKTQRLPLSYVNYLNNSAQLQEKDKLLKRREYCFTITQILSIMKFLLDLVQEIVEVYACGPPNIPYPKINLSHVLIDNHNSAMNEYTQSEFVPCNSNRIKPIRQLIVSRNKPKKEGETMIKTAANTTPKPVISLKYIHPIQSLISVPHVHSIPSPNLAFSNLSSSTNPIPSMRVPNRQSYFLSQEQQRQIVVSQMISDVGICLLSICLLEDVMQTCCDVAGEICLSVVENKIEQVAATYIHGIEYEDNNNIIVPMLCSTIYTLITQQPQCQSEHLGNKSSISLNPQPSPLSLKECRNLYNKIYIQHQKLLLKIKPNELNKERLGSNDATSQQLSWDNSIGGGKESEWAATKGGVRFVKSKSYNCNDKSSLYKDRNNKYSNQNISLFVQNINNWNTCKTGKTVIYNNTQDNKKGELVQVDNVININSSQCNQNSIYNNVKAPSRGAMSSLKKKLRMANNVNMNIRTRNIDSDIIDVNQGIYKKEDPPLHMVNKCKASEVLKAIINKQTVLKSTQNKLISPSLAKYNSVNITKKPASNSNNNQEHQKLQDVNKAVMERVDWNIEKSSERKIQDVNYLKPKIREWMFEPNTHNLRVQHIIDANKMEEFNKNHNGTQQLEMKNMSKKVRNPSKIQINIQDHPQSENNKLNNKIQQLDKQWGQNEQLFKNMPQFEQLNSDIFNFNSSRLMFINDNSALKSSSMSKAALLGLDSHRDSQRQGQLLSRITKDGVLLNSQNYRATQQNAKMKAIMNKKMEQPKNTFKETADRVEC